MSTKQTFNKFSSKNKFSSIFRHEQCRFLHKNHIGIDYFGVIDTYKPSYALIDLLKKKNT
jgi:hypothetical protein